MTDPSGLCLAEEPAPHDEPTGSSWETAHQTLSSRGSDKPHRSSLTKRKGIRAEHGATSWTGFAFAYVHPDYTGTLVPNNNVGGATDPRDDIAVLSMGTQWSYANNAFNRLRMWTGSTQTGQDLHIYGHGATSDSGNHVELLATSPNGSVIDVDWHTGSGYFLNDAGEARICAGDSGGPAIKEDQDWDVIYGVASEVDGADASGNNNCPGSGDKMRWTKMSSKVDWVEQVMRHNPAFGAGFSCNRYSPSWGIYARCW